MVSFLFINIFDTIFVLLLRSVVNHFHGYLVLFIQYYFYTIYLLIRNNFPDMQLPDSDFERLRIFTTFLA